ncbi:hypothetical protein CUMW_051170 [Citrus unshiu]|nr:hypothetical protein CUMW_051170 [Citrus unshiu]
MISIYIVSTICRVLAAVKHKTFDASPSLIPSSPLLLPLPSGSVVVTAAAASFKIIDSIVVTGRRSPRELLNRYSDPLSN